MMRFLYDCLPYGEEKAEGGGGDGLPPDKQISPLMDIASKTRNILLYGPPGGGKTQGKRTT
jgi:hypothetical protein